ncbi:MAG: mechanosensitive ion channel family protein [Pirellulaceae bacterium]
MRYRILLCALPAFALILFSQSTLFAQESGGSTGDVLAAHSHDAARSLLETVKSAVAGDTEAIQTLASQFIVPAIVAIGVFLLGYFVASFVGRVVGGQVARRVDVTFGKFLGKMIKNGLMFMLLLGVLGYFGVDVTSFAAIIAALGFAVGMALQGTLSNFAAGIMLMVFRPFKVGEYIQLGSEEGWVEEIDLFTTRINSIENVHLIVPNGQIFGSTITNFSHNEVRRVEVTVGVDYGADVDRSRAVLEAAISEVPGTVADPAPQVVMAELADSSVNWHVRAWCEQDNYWAVKELLTVAAKKGLDLNGIGIPFPQMQLHLPPSNGVAIKRAA